MLPQRLPTEYTEVTDGGVTELPLRTDFICWMRFEELITDCRIPEDRLVITAMRLIFPVMPRDLSRAAMFMLWFYRCGEPPKETSESGTMLSSRRAYMTPLENISPKRDCINCALPKPKSMRTSPSSSTAV